MAKRSRTAAPAADPQGPLAEARSKWIGLLDDEERAHKQYRDYAKQASDEFYAVSCPDDAAVKGNNVNYPLFWSIINVLLGRVFGSPPKPDVRKRYPDEPSKQPAAGTPPAGQPPMPPQPAAGPQPGMPPQGPQAAQPPPPPQVDDNKISQLLERAIGYVIDTTEFLADVKAGVLDLLVEGGGVAKVEIDVDTEQHPIIGPDGQELPELDKDGQPVFDDKGNPVSAMQTVVVDRTLRLRHFSFAKQFRWEPHQHWSDVSWIAFKHGMTKEEIQETWDVTMSNPGASAKTLKMGGGYGLDDSKKPESDKYERLFDVYEIWDKKERQRLYVCPNHDEAFEITDDPLQLKDFFPCPKPMMLNIKGDDLVPQPDYSKCETLFKTANMVYGRIDSLARQVKDVGFYDSGFGELASLNTADDGAMVPISNIVKRFNDVAPGTVPSYDSVVYKQNNQVKVQVLSILQEQLDQIEAKIWKSYGVSDIQRGSTDPNETATAQNIKAEWADIRVGQKISMIALFCRDIFRIFADVLGSFEPQVLEKMTGIMLNPAEVEVLQSDVGRCYAIDVESDSTVVQDENAMVQQRLMFMDSVTKYLQVLGPAMAQNQIPADLGKELLLCVVNTFKTGRQIEDAINNLPGTMQQITGMQQQLQQAGQHIQQQQKQLQDQGKQLQAVNQQKEQRENIKTSVDAGKTDADTTKTQVETAIMAGQAAQPQVVVPIR